MIATAQLICGLLWLAAAAYFSPAVWRLFVRRAVARDLFTAVIAFVGLTQAGFVLRWMLWPEAVHFMETAELNLWLALYIGSSIEAAALVGGSILFRLWRDGDD